MELGGKNLIALVQQARYDDIYPRIAQAAPDCQFAFIEHPLGKSATEVFRKRLTDTAWRATIRERMKHNKHRVYRDRTSITALEEFLTRVARDRRAGS